MKSFILSKEAIELVVNRLKHSQKTVVAHGLTYYSGPCTSCNATCEGSCSGGCIGSCQGQCTDQTRS